MPRSALKFCNVYCNPPLPKPKPDYCSSKKRRCPNIVNDVKTKDMNSRIEKLKQCASNLDG